MGRQVYMQVRDAKGGDVAAYLIARQQVRVRASDCEGASNHSASVV